MLKEKEKDWAWFEDNFTKYADINWKWIMGPLQWWWGDPESMTF